MMLKNIYKTENPAKIREHIMERISESQIKALLVHSELTSKLNPDYSRKMGNSMIFLSTKGRIGEKEKNFVFSYFFIK